VINTETGPPTNGSGGVAENADHPTEIDTPSKVSDTPKLTTTRPYLTGSCTTRETTIACIDRNCLNCWCGRSTAFMGEEVGQW
jgi:hypothetical protein